MRCGQWNWTVDFKGWWRFGEAGRCEPLTVRDEFSRYVLELRALDNARTQTVRKAFARIFERHGLPEAIRSDNGRSSGCCCLSAHVISACYADEPRRR